MNHLNIDSAVICVKTIVDANRCFTCDQLNVSSVRYTCGHSICKNCLVTHEHCLLCTTQLNPCPQLPDEYHNLRALHASELVTAFQDVFNVDVNRRPRISDKLKLEKLLFPKCIQAPVKYVNKRKSLNTPDNIGTISSAAIILPGENIFRSPKMDNKIEYVNQWLSNNDSNRRNIIRKPLEDLNINHSFFSNKPKNILPHSIKKSSKHKKRTCTEAFVLGNNIKQVSTKRLKKTKGPEKIHIENNVNLNIVEANLDQNESGIVIDDETLFIDNSQSEDNEKYNHPTSKEARLNDDITTPFLNNSVKTSKTVPSNTTSNIYKRVDKCAVNGCRKPVVFYRRSSLIDACQLCNEFNTHIKTNKSFNNVTITIDSKAFHTSINFSNCVQKKTSIVSRKSVMVQTDTNNTYIDLINNDPSTKVVPMKINTNVDLHPCTRNVDKSLQNKSFPAIDIKNIDKLEKMAELNFAEKGQSKNELVSSSKCLVIEDSDVSDNDECSDVQNTIEVSADVHRSCSSIDYEVLYTLLPHEYEHRSRHVAREHTPVSTDSSDKENYDPNRSRQMKTRDKKCDNKK